jgi:hypothetical protein
VKDRIAKAQPKGLSLVNIRLYRNVLNVIQICWRWLDKTPIKINVRFVWTPAKYKTSKM